MTDNGSPADANAASEPAEEFPSKLRVHALARFLGLTSRQVLAHLANLGVQTRSPQSSVDRELAQAVAARVRAEGEGDETAAAPAEPSAAPTEAPETAEAPVTAEVPAAEPAAAPEAPTQPEAAAVENPAGQRAHAEAPTLFSAASSGYDAPLAATGEEEPSFGGGPLFLQPQAPEEKPKAARSARAKAKVKTPVQDGAEQGQTDTPAEAASPDQTPTDSGRVEAKADEAGADQAGADQPSADQPSADQPRADEPSADEARTGRTTVGTADAETAADADAGDDNDTDDDSDTDDSDTDDSDTDDSNADDSGSGRSRRRRRGRRGRGRGRGDQGGENGDDDESADTDAARTDAADTAADTGAAKTVDRDTDTDTGDRGRADRTGGADDAASDRDDSDEADADAEGADDSRSEDGRPSGKRNKRRRRAGGDRTDDAEGTKARSDAADQDGSGSDSAGADADDSDDSADDESGDGSSTRRRRRRRRRKVGGEQEDASPDDPPNTVVHEREPRSKRVRDEVQGISGSTRLEAKRQRRRDGRDAGRRRPPILTESEFLARREAVDRVMVVRERSANSRISTGDGHEIDAVEDYTQVAVLEDGVLVEHFVTTSTSSSMVGNIYLGRVQNVLPGMEAAFVDIGRGRNGVLYAGEVNWDAAGLDGGSRKIEQALKPGDNVLVQVSKDPVGHKGARLTTQISLAGRYLVYVPGGSSTGISRKLPDVERKRLKQILAKLVPDEAGVIIRTASEGVSAEELGADIARLESQWKAIDASVAEAKKGGASAPKALYEEPDLLVRVVRDLFNEDFKKLVVEGDKAWNLVEGYVNSVASDLMERVEKFEKPHADAPDSFVVHRIDEQLAKALDRKVWLPSGGTLIIEHTEAMTVVDVNTGKFTGSGGNLEETVTRNNLEAAEEIVRQMRLRDIGGMIIVDFIDMVLESNRDLVLRRLTEALARDRTRHQVSEVTSLGLVQMTRKRLGTGLLEAFSTTCTSCNGRGIIVHANPVEVRSDDTARPDAAGSKRSRRGKKKVDTPAESKPAVNPAHKPAAEHPLFRAMAATTHDGEEVEGGHDEAAPADVAVAEVSRGERRARAAESEAKDEKAEQVTEPDTEKVRPQVDAQVAAPAEKAEAAVAAEPTDGGAPAVARRRRRVVRRPAQTTTAPENVVMTAVDVVPETPTTTFGPISTDPGEATVAVRRRPRKRTAGRPAGPPPADT
ncbi:Rne/Rng family ribonuclease [Gordonia jinghuaiqii]|uniref:Ribonuclease E n=1 Tax=Gordonia jinghuaiqii TaxID=2758710 RepID=A0A7D7QJS7_9ACTN|nr:translation initiation factor IF-2 N-terminal domain-containing protein [Gordonia jinghuaiqii]MCR5980461.1 Rne/Rng family ribonuclease [Gordonia jinghuaiqii]QMT03364.1 translation initiation factor IF-2 N-terminal domain-containing protein [Gordonia jinghuaiqii]